VVIGAGDHLVVTGHGDVVAGERTVRMPGEQSGGSTDVARRGAGVRIYRAATAPALHESGAARSEFGGNEELREVATTLASSECSDSRMLVHQDEDEGGMSVVYLFFKPGFPLFRHMHDVDSLYVVISGSAVGFMGTETLRPGDCFAVQAGTPYYYTAGPEGVEVLEMFHGADTVTVIYTDNADGRLQEAEEAVRANREAWHKITAGPLYEANAAGS
jgi:mannose-6-phosphate isomerase-like protein (cupin superfamily)